MYSICEKDSVRLLEDAPQPSVTAPSQAVYATGERLLVAYYVQDTGGNYAETVTPNLGAGMIGFPVAVINFVEPVAHMFCPPAAEVLSRHPLAERGLEPFGVYEVRDSSWVRQLARLSPAHKVERTAAARHYVFTFYDQVFECAARGFNCVLRFGSVAEVLQCVLKESEDKPGLG